MTWNEFIDCADGIRSIKVRTALDDMRTRLNRYAGLPEADALRHKSACLLA